MRRTFCALLKLSAFIAVCVVLAFVFSQAAAAQAPVAQVNAQQTNTTTAAQTNVTQPNIAPSRITQAIDEANITRLRGNTHPLAQARFDQGAAPDSLPMQRMLLVLKRSPDQESALDALLDQQQDSTSPNFHQWITPQQFGQQFGPSDQDIQTITTWLQSQGFTVAGVSNGRTVIEFSGTAGLVRQAFHTEIHRYTVNGQDHWANNTDPQIPAALAPVVAGINTLYNFPRRAMHHLSGTVTRSASTGQYKPTNSSNSLFTLGGTCGVPGTACYGVSPYDFATIYNLLPLWQASTDGTGQTIAIVGQSDISLQDIQSFRSFFGLPNDAVNVMVEGPDPGIVEGDETESDLDVEWSGAVARGATIDFVTSQTTESSLGVDLAAQYIVDNNVAPVLSESYGICELFLGATSNQFYNQLWQQGSAEGITVLVSEGDSGSAVCDRNAGTQRAAVDGLSVNGISSTPYNVAVGGTDFFDLTDPGTYWSSTNKPPITGAAPTLSALSYIPETTWNDSCTNAVFGTLGFSGNPETDCNDPILTNDGFVQADGGSGGMSNCITSTGSTPATCTAGYSKPSWQSTLTPNDSARDVPDVSLYAAAGSPSGAFYVICEADQLPSGTTSCNPNDPNTEFLSIGGTSASTPAFAGIMAVVDQATGSRQGNANYTLYKLAAGSGASCNSTGTGTLNPSCVFYDITNGTIAMPCAINSVDEPGPDSTSCPIQTPPDTVGVLSGYSTTAGYDLATGLGSVNAANLVSNWKTSNSSLKQSTTTLMLNGGNAINITHGQNVPIQVSVAGSGATPSGTVSLMANVASGSAQNVASAALSSGSATFSTADLPGDPTGMASYTVFAQYSGDATYKSSSSTPQSVSVNPEASTTAVTVELFIPSSGEKVIPTPSSFPYGFFYALIHFNVTSAAADACSTNGIPIPGNYGCPTGLLTTTDSLNGGAPTPLDAGTYQLNSQGYALDETANLPAGTNTIQASYPGDNSYLPSIGTTTITVTKALASVLIAPAPTSNFEDPYTLNVTVEGAQAGSAPTGQVSLFNGSTQLGAPVSLSNGIAGSPEGSAAASATIVTSQLPLGTNSLTVKYSGDSNYSANSASGYAVLTQYLTSVAVSSSSPTIQRGSSATFTATVTAEHPGGPAMTGTVTFLDGGFAIGSPVSLVNGQAQFVASSLTAGTHSISVRYSGDTNYTSATGTLAGGETVNLLATTMTLTTSNASIAVGQSVTLTATVSPIVPGGPAITGFVGFHTCPTTDTNNCLFALGSAPISNGQAQLTTTIIPSGTIEVLADYDGDLNYNYSSATTAEVAGPALSISANPSALTIPSPGQSASTTLTFTSSNGLAGAGTLTSTTCGTSFSEEITCSLSPFTLPANGTATATLTFSSTAAVASIPNVRNNPFTPGSNSRRLLLLSFAFGATMLLFFARRKHHGQWRLVFGVLIFAVILSGISCGGGGSSSGSGGNNPPPNPGTPAGAVSPLTVSVTINGVTQTVLNLTLTVN